MTLDTKMQNDPDTKLGRPRLKLEVLTSAERTARYRAKLRATGRIMEIAAINPQFDDATNKTFVQIIVSSPFAVYRLDLDRAKAMVKELAEAIEVCERSIQPGKSVNKNDYFLITDNDTISVSRKLEQRPIATGNQPRKTLDEYNDESK